MRFVRAIAVTLAALAIGCAGDPRVHQPGQAPRDGDRRGLFGPLLEHGKFDDAGHPLGAEVWQAEQSCEAATGGREAEGWGAWPESHGAGGLCRLRPARIGRGRFTLNLRWLSHVAAAPAVSGTGVAAAADGGLDGEAGLPGPSTDASVDAVDGSAPPAAPPPAPPVFTLSVRDEDGLQLAARTVRHDELRAPMTYQNLPLTFVHQREGALVISVEWHGEVPLRLDYIELFRAARRVVIGPRSGALPGGELTVELMGADGGDRLQLSCGDASLDEAVAQLLDEGRATRQQTAFRQLYRLPAAPLLAGCSRPVRLEARMLAAGGWTRATARVSYRGAPIACAYRGATDGLRVLLSGFEPFPANSSADNSSQQAVLAFDPESVPGVAVLPVILPVEWESAAEIAAELIGRCQPDIVVGLGQGRDRVEVERLAYNRRDSSDLAGGVPDNRGVVYDGQPIAPGGPPEVATRLPAQEIVAALAAAEVPAAISADPGRYICNDLFYGVMTAVAADDRIAGFIHLPTIWQVGEAERALLQTIVSTAVRESVLLRQRVHAAAAR